MMQIFEIKFVCSKISRIFAVLFREHSSVGLEHLPYKQRVGGSTPSAPTRSLTVKAVRLFLLYLSLYSVGIRFAFVRYID